MNDVKLFSRGVAWLLGIVAVLVALSIAGLGYRYIMAEPKGRVDAEVQIQSGANRIAQYNHFFDLCVSVQNAEASIDAQTASLESAEDAGRRGEIQENLAALAVVRLQGINQYNADARKDYTSGQFLASNLPYQLSADDYKAGGSKTKCAS